MEARGRFYLFDPYGKPFKRFESKRKCWVGHVFLFFYERLFYVCLCTSCDALHTNRILMVCRCRIPCVLLVGSLSLFILPELLHQPCRTKAVRLHPPSSSPPSCLPRRLRPGRNLTGPNWRLLVGSSLWTIPFFYHLVAIKTQPFARKTC